MILIWGSLNAQTQNHLELITASGHELADGSAIAVMMSLRHR